MAQFGMNVLCKRKGQGMVEYALILGIIVVLAVAFIAGAGNATEGIKTIFQHVVDRFV